MLWILASSPVSNRKLCGSLEDQRKPVSIRELPHLSPVGTRERAGPVGVVDRKECSVQRCVFGEYAETAVIARPIGFRGLLVDNLAPGVSQGS